MVARISPIRRGLKIHMANRYKFVDEGRSHLHTLDGRPLVGTSSVGSVVAKPLSYYASGQAVMKFGARDPKVLTRLQKGVYTAEEEARLKPGAKLYKVLQSEKDALMAKAKEAKAMIAEMTLEDYIALLGQAYRAHKEATDASAERGTELHAKLELFIKDRMNGMVDNYDERLKPFIEWADRRVKRFLWSEIHCYSEKHWLGGISDCGFEDVDGKVGIMDFKSSKEAYLTQFWQCAGYAMEISENGGFDRNGNPTHPELKGLKFDYFAVLPFGMAKPVPQVNVDVGKCQEMFLHELAIYNALPRD